jgi:predicted alpha/beta-hydrolase family hydrolase
VSVEADELSFPVSESVGSVPALLSAPRDAWAVYVLAHGAGAGMRHPFLEEVASSLGTAGVATLRYQFPYMDKRRGRPDPPAVLERTVRAAVDCARAHTGGLAMFAGGKSMGGRMTSQAAAAEPLPAVIGIAFLGFPLHAPGKPSMSRAAHLAKVTVPMLFVQGTRDDFAGIERMRAVTAELGAPATLHVVEDGDHSFRVLKRSGRSAPDVMMEIRDALVAWMRLLAAP